MSGKDKRVRLDKANLNFQDLNFGRVVTYFSAAHAVDGFDLAIKPVPDDRKRSHANVELIFFQDKGSGGRTDVVAALRMQAYQLKQLRNLIDRRLDALASETNESQGPSKPL